MVIRPTIAVAAAALLALSFAGCSKSSNVSTQSAGSSSTAIGTVLVPKGTDFYGRLQNEIDSKTSKNGDTFSLAEQDTLFHRDAALHGAVIDGHVDNVTPAGPMHKPGMTIVFDDIRMPDGTKAPIDVQLVSMGAFGAKSHHMRTLGLMIGGAMAGHMAAAHAGKSHGGMMGAAAGYMLSQAFKTDIDVKPGTMLEVKFLNAAKAGAPAAQST